MAGNKSVELNVLARNKDALAKIAQVKADYDLMKKEMAADPAKIGIDSKTLDAGYRAQMRALTQELFKTGQQADKTKFQVKSLGSAFTDLVTGGGISADMSIPQKIIAGLGAATGIAEPAVAGLTFVTMALASGLTSAAMGLGVFGAVAKSVFTSANTVASDYAAVQNATTGKQAAAAMKVYQAQLAQLPKSQQELAASIIATKGEWNNFVKANSSGVADILSKGMGLLPGLLKDLQVFMKPVETALGTIIGQLGKGINSAGFKGFLDSFAKLSGANLYEFAHALGNIIVGIGGILKAFLPMSTTVMGGLEHLTKRFAEWGTTLSSHSGFKSLVAEATQEAPKLVSAFGNIAGAIKNIVGDMAGMTVLSNSTLLWNLVNPLTALLDALSKNKTLVDLALWGWAVYSSLSKVVGLADGVGSLMKNVDKFSGGGLTKLASSMGILKNTAAEGETAVMELNTAFLTSPVFWVVAAIVALIAVFVILWLKCAAFRNFWKDLWKDIKGAAEDVWGWFKSTWPAIEGVLVKPFKAVWGAIVGVFDDITKWVSSNFDPWWAKNGQAVMDIWHTIWNVIHAVVKAVTVAVTAVVKLWWSAISTEFRIGWAVVSGIWNVLWSYVSMIFKIYWTLVSTEVKVGWLIISTAFDIAISAIKTVWTVFWAFLSAILKTAWDAFQAVIKIGWDLIVGIFTVFINLITGHWSKAWDAMKQMLGQIWNAITQLFKQAFGNLWSAIQTSFGAVISFFSGLGSRILSAVGNLSKLLWNAGADIIKGLLGGLNSMIGSLTGALKHITSLIPIHKGPPEKDKVLLRNSGQLVMAGLIDGLQDGIPGLTAQLTRTTNVIARTKPAIPSGHGPGSNAAITAEWIGGTGADQEFITWLKKNIRIRGGDPGVLGR